MKTAKYIVFVLAIVSLVAANTARSEANQSADSEGIMDITDLDGDDRIDLEEYRDRITDVYFFLDANKDGKLTVVEIQRSFPNLDPAVIDNADVNGDTIITIYEFRYVLYKDFDMMDKNNDGSLDKQEMKTAVEEK
jgi:Ca2+-binding EF-hand superfamily protein